MNYKIYVGIASWFGKNTFNSSGASEYSSKFKTAKINHEFKERVMQFGSEEFSGNTYVPLSSFKRELLNAFRLAVSSDFRRFDSLSSSFYTTDRKDIEIT